MSMKPPLPDNGWRTGRDPIQRWLRIVATIVCLVVFAWLALDPSRRDWPTLTIALGALLVLLGYEAIVRLPYLGRSDNPATPTAPPLDPYQQQYPYQQQQQYPYTPPMSGGEDGSGTFTLPGDETSPEV